MITQPNSELHAKFPNDLPLADLTKISLRKLFENDEAETQALSRACMGVGFFLLDFSGSHESDLILNEVAQCFDVHRGFFNLSTAEKLACVNHSGKPGALGYKELGNIKDSKGNVDRCEMMTYGTQQILSSSAVLQTKPLLRESTDLLRSAFNHLHSIALMILSKLESALMLPAGTFRLLSDPNAPTQSQLRFLHMPPYDSSNATPSLGSHTDNGSIAMIFNELGGLQIVPPGLDPDDEMSWRWVRPEPGCAVVNLGDSMVTFSGGILRSIMHRVVNPPGTQAAEHRYSGGYFLKPHNDVVMRALVESPIVQKAVDLRGEEMEHMKYLAWVADRSQKLKNKFYKTGAEGEDRYRI